MLEDGSTGAMEAIVGDKVWFAQYAGITAGGEGAASSEKEAFVILRQDDLTVRARRPGE